jgi:hypothetical protein
MPATAAHSYAPVMIAPGSCRLDIQVVVAGAQPVAEAALRRQAERGQERVPVLGLQAAADGRRLRAALLRTPLSPRANSARANPTAPTGAPLITMPKRRSGRAPPPHSQLAAAFASPRPATRMFGPQALHLGLLRKQPLVASPACSTWNASRQRLLHRPHQAPAARLEPCEAPFPVEGSAGGHHVRVDRCACCHRDERVALLPAFL